MPSFKLFGLVALISVSTLFSTVAGAAAAPARLSVQLTGAETVDGVSNFKVKAVITNKGNEEVKLLKDPRGLLDNFPTETFRIANANGEAPKFNGVRVKYVPRQVVANNDPKNFMVLAPGKSVTVEHDLSEGYDFSQTGASKYTVDGSSLFLLVDSAGNIVPVQAETSKFTTSLSGNLNKSAAKPSLRRRTSFDGCDDSQQGDINTATQDAQDYTTTALEFLEENSSSNNRYDTWFGDYDSDRYDTVVNHFTNLNTTGYTGYTYDCSTCTESGVFAYVYPDAFGTIYLCEAFWSAEATGTDSKAGTLVHESSHFDQVAGTQDYAYGQEDSKNLAKEYPDDAVMNADSHEYFAENNPPLAE